MIYQILFGYFFVQLFLLVKLDFTANDDKDGYLYNLDNIYTFRQFYFNTSLIGELPEESKDKAARKAYIKVSFKTNSVSKLLTDKKELPRVGIYLFKLEKLAMIYLNEFNYQKKFGLRFFQEYRSVANKYAWTGYVESTPKQATNMVTLKLRDVPTGVYLFTAFIEGEPAFTIEDFVSYGFQFFANVGMRHKVLENVPVNWTVPVYADWQAEHEEIPLSNVYDEL